MSPGVPGGWGQNNLTGALGEDQKFNISCDYSLLDINECPNGENTHGCHENATCTDTDGSYTCMCDDGYTGDGFNCEGELYTVKPFYTGHTL